MRCLVSAAAATLRRCRTFSACANPMALIRFRAEDGSIMYGEPTDSSMQAAKVVKGLLDVQWTGETARVSQLLGTPLAACSRQDRLRAMCQGQAAGCGWVHRVILSQKNYLGIENVRWGC